MTVNLLYSLPEEIGSVVLRLLFRQNTAPLICHQGHWPYYFCSNGEVFIPRCPRSPPISEWPLSMRSTIPEWYGPYFYSIGDAFKTDCSRGTYNTPVWYRKSCQAI